MNPLEIYIHIPFCKRRCAYCDFLSFPLGDTYFREYVNALKKEIYASRNILAGHKISTIFIGGGTPSVLPLGMIEEIMDALQCVSSFSLDGDQKTEEVSLECNPGTVTKELLKSFHKAGINRLSFGCQSTIDEELSCIGRIHTYEEFLESFHLARESGFSNINVDLMSALPGQTLVTFETSLRRIAELNPEHISVYSLILEEGTPLFETADAYAFPDEDTERYMYERTAEILSLYGYQQYEISNYAKPGLESKHNLGYWTDVPYIGFGLGASSYLGYQRFKNTENLSLYLRESDHIEVIRDLEEELSLKDRMAECMILGLRLTKGISEGTFQKRFGIDMMTVYGEVIKKYLDLGLLIWDEGHLRLSRQGISLSNQVMAAFLSDED